MEEVGRIVAVVVTAAAVAGDTDAGGGVAEAPLSVVVVVVVGKTEAGASTPDCLDLRGRPRPRFFSTLSPYFSSS